MNRHALLGLLVFSALKLSAGEPTHDEIAGRPALEIADATAQLKKTFVTPVLQCEHKAGENLIWCLSFQLAWNELCNQLNGAVKLDKPHPFVDQLNEKLVTWRAIDEDSYVAVAGEGQRALDELKAQLEKKFKGAATPKLLPNDPRSLFAYAYLFKSLRFETPFHRINAPLQFGESAVQSFGLSDGENREQLSRQIVVLDYVAPENFVIELKTLDSRSRLILARLSAGKTLKQTVDGVLKRVADAKPGTLKYDERFQAPLIDFEITRIFNELIGPRVLNAGRYNGWQITDARQLIRLKFDEKGAVLKSEARAAAKNGHRPRTHIGAVAADLRGARGRHADHHADDGGRQLLILANRKCPG